MPNAPISPAMMALIPSRSASSSANSGPALPPEEVAILSYEHPLQYVHALKIDGLTHEEMRQQSGFTGSNSGYELPPGEHTIELLGVLCQLTGIAAIRRCDYAEHYFKGEGWEKIEPHTQVCLEFQRREGSGLVTTKEQCAVKGVWELTFTAEPQHNYQISVSFGEELPVPEEGLGALVFENMSRSGNPPVVVRPHFTPSSYRPVSPYLLDKLTGMKVGTWKPLEGPSQQQIVW